MSSDIRIPLAVTLIAACLQPNLVPAGYQACPSSGLRPAVAPSGLVVPVALSLPEPPTPIPARLRPLEAIVRVVVDTTGHAIQDSVTVCGLDDAAYSRRLVAVALSVQWRPAVLNQRKVVWESLLTFQAGNPGSSSRLAAGRSW